MARRNNSIQPMSGYGDKGGRKTSAGVVALLVIVSVLGLAWYDGGEEPIRPIEQEIRVPEGR